MLSQFVAHKEPAHHTVVVVQVRRRLFIDCMQSGLLRCWLLLNRGELLGIQIHSKQKNS